MFSRRDPRLNRGRIATVAGASASNGPNFAALGAAFWIDASNPNSYTESGGTLTSLKSLVSGSSLSTIVGAPKFATDPRDNKPCFSWPLGAGECVKGVDATYIAAVAGTDRPFCSIIVFETGDPTLYVAMDSVKNTADAGNGQEFVTASSVYYYERDGFPSGPARVATSENVQAGLVVLVQRSADGLTVKTSVNGAAESTAAAFLTAGAITPNIVAVGIQTGSTDTHGYYGVIKERAYFATDRTPAEIATWVAALQAKWRAPPQGHFIGDSITAASLATNGGMVALLQSALRADGLNFDPNGPIAMPNGAGGQVFYPLRCSAVSGNTCAQMTTRVTSVTLGLGLGGGSRGHYRMARISFLFAGTNDLSSANYSTLLDTVYARMLQHGLPDFRIAVTPITNIIGSEAAVTAYNAALVTIWDAFEVAHPGILIRWNAYLANPHDGSTTYYVDNTHPNSAGYLRMVNDPTYGLYQAVKPYITSIQ